MCLKLSLILSHLSAPKAHTSQGTIHRYIHQTRSYRTTLPVPARSCLPSKLHQASHAAHLARHACPPGQLCPPQPSLPTRPAVPSDPASHASARRPCPPSGPSPLTRPAGTSPLLRPRCSRPCQPCIFQAVPASCSSAPVTSFPFAAVLKMSPFLATPLKMEQLQEWGFAHLCMNLACGSELAIEEAAESWRCLNDGSATEGSWQN